MPLRLGGLASRYPPPLVTPSACQAVLAQLAAPQPRPMSEIVILAAHHANNLGDRVDEYDQPQTVRIQVLLEDHIDTAGRTERRLAAYELHDDGQRAHRLGHLPKDAPRQPGNYLAALQRPEGKKRLEGRLSPMKAYETRA